MGATGPQPTLGMSAENGGFEPEAPVVTWGGKLPFVAVSTEYSSADQADIGGQLPLREIIPASVSINPGTFLVRRPRAEAGRCIRCRMLGTLA
jgi:hypothetical protein